MRRLALDTWKLRVNIFWFANNVDTDGAGARTSTLASSRYRAILPAVALQGAGHVITLTSLRAWLDGSTAAAGDPDLVVVGKVLPQGDARAFAATCTQALARLDQLRQQGVAVLADFCDDHFLHPVLGPWWRSLAQRADLCVAATPEMAARVRPHASGPVHVISDPVAADFLAPTVWQPATGGTAQGLTGRLLRHLMPAQRALTLAWYGVPNNWPAMQRWAERLPALRDEVSLRLNVVSQPAPDLLAYVADFNSRHAPRLLIEFHPWTLATQQRVITRADIVLVPSRLDQGDKTVKSTNRVTDALVAGKYVIATLLPAYRVYKGSVNFIDDPVQGIRHYLADPQRALAMIERGQAVARQHFAVDVVADLWRTAFDAAWDSLATDDPPRTLPSVPATTHTNSAPRPLRVVVFAVAAIPTYQLRFLRPWWDGGGEPAVDHILLTENDLRARFGKTQDDAAAAWLLRQIDRFEPTHLVFCRYAGPHPAVLLRWAIEHGVPTVMHIDDDLLDVPTTLKPGKHAFHSDPARLESLRLLLDQVDLVHTANQELIQRLHAQGIRNHSTALTLPCAGQVLCGAPAADVPELRIGYMGGNDHTSDLALVVPALVEVLDNHPEVVFELFGPLALPPELEVFGARVRLIPPLYRYEDFLVQLADRHWHIGLCPLLVSTFNAVKTHIKWVEYTSVGAAVVSSGGTIYDVCCADGRGSLVATPTQWAEVLRGLIGDRAARIRQVSRAQDHLRRHYRIAQLRGEMVDMLKHASARHAGRSAQSAIARATEQAGSSVELVTTTHGRVDPPGYDTLHRSHIGKVSDKWSSYFGVYDRCLAPYRQLAVALLEIGVQNGGSLELWCRYFPHGRVFVGCDIEESCGLLRFDDDRVRVVVGNANSEQTAARIAEASAQFDVIIDDGSHYAHDIVESFLRYFSWLRPGGVYIAEDVHTMYMHGYGGGLRAPSSAQEFFKLLVDIVNYQHWQGRAPLGEGVAAFAQGGRVPQFLLDGWVERVEFENSFVIIHKAHRPGHQKLGQRVVSGTVADVRSAVLVYQQSQDT
jgi:hypothetical protein